MAKPTTTKKNKALSKSEILRAIVDANGEDVSGKHVKAIIETLVTVGHKELKDRRLRRPRLRQVRRREEARSSGARGHQPLHEGEANVCREAREQGSKGEGGEGREGRGGVTLQERAGPRFSYRGLLLEATTRIPGSSKLRRWRSASSRGRPEMSRTLSTLVAPPSGEIRKPLTLSSAKRFRANSKRGSVRLSSGQSARGPRDSRPGHRKPWSERVAPPFGAERARTG